MSVEIALEGVYPDGPEAAGKERWVGRERERERHYMEQKEKWESEPINIHVMNNSLTSLRLFIECLSKTGGNCIQLSTLIRDVKLLKICEMKHNDVISSFFNLQQHTHLFRK